MAPPPAARDWDVRFATSDAAGGWEEASRTAPTALKECWTHLRQDPRRRTPRQHPLKDRLAIRSIGPDPLEQWQYETTGAGRVWYCIDDTRRLVWLTAVSVITPAGASAYDRLVAEGRIIEPTGDWQPGAPRIRPVGGPVSELIER